MHVYEHNQSSKVPSVYLVEINMCLPMHACVLCLAKKNLVFVRDLADTNNQVACLILVILYAKRMAKTNRVYFAPVITER